MIDFATAREFCGFLRWRLAATHAAAWAYETPSGDQTVVEVNEKKNPLGEYTTLFVWAQPDMVFRIVDASRLREEHEGGAVSRDGGGVRRFSRHDCSPLCARACGEKPAVVTGRLLKI